MQDEEGEVNNGEEMVPPQVIGARSHVTFSVFEGAWRTLKGRDLRRLSEDFWNDPSSVVAKAFEETDQEINLVQLYFPKGGKQYRLSLTMSPTQSCTILLARVCDMKMQVFRLDRPAVQAFQMWLSGLRLFKKRKMGFSLAKILQMSKS